MLAALLLILLPARSEERAVPPDTVITMQRGACERRCAVYKVVIFGDGSLLFDGQYYVRKPGVFKDKLTPAQVKALVDAFQAADYFNLGDQGCSEAGIDTPWVLTSLVLGRRGNSVSHSLACRGPIPQKLKELEDQIDKIANTARWK
jgi:hypothetical protein